MKKSDRDVYLELAELVQANVSGPVGKKMVADAQRKLVSKLQKNGVVSEDEADVLKS